jgi:hypothetical protein
MVVTNIVNYEEYINEVEYFFLVIGLFLSVISKVLQFKIKAYAYIGNIIVIPAVFFY